MIFPQGETSAIVRGWMWGRGWKFDKNHIPISYSGRRMEDAPTYSSGQHVYHTNNVGEVRFISTDLDFPDVNDPFRRGVLSQGFKKRDPVFLSSGELDLIATRNVWTRESSWATHSERYIQVCNSVPNNNLEKRFWWLSDGEFYLTLTLQQVINIILGVEVSILPSEINPSAIPRVAQPNVDPPTSDPIHTPNTHDDDDYDDISQDNERIIDRQELELWERKLNDLEISLNERENDLQRRENEFNDRVNSWPTTSNTQPEAPSIDLIGGRDFQVSWKKATSSGKFRSISDGTNLPSEIFRAGTRPPVVIVYRTARRDLQHDLVKVFGDNMHGRILSLNGIQITLFNVRGDFFEGIIPEGKSEDLLG